MRSVSRGLAGLALAAVTIVVPTGAAPAAADVGMCDGHTPTLVGTTGDDLLAGTPGPDVIAGLAGDDVISGGSGDDVICGDDGTDQLSGGHGDDRVFGGLDAVWEVGSSGGATWYATVGDVVAGGAGDDLIDVGYDPRQLSVGSWSVDEVRLGGTRGTEVHLGLAGELGTAVGQGRDRIMGQRLLVVRGSDGPDVIWGSPYDDAIHGGLGDDVIRGGFGDDSISDGGGADDDVLEGGGGEDHIMSWGGADRLDGGPDADYVFADGRRLVSLRGGGGNDQLSFPRAGAGCPALDGGKGRDSLTLHPAKAFRFATIPVDLGGGPIGDCGSVAGSEELHLEGGKPLWVIAGTARSEVVTIVFFGRLEAHLRGGDDVAHGGHHDDVLDGGPGDDVADGGNGVDACPRVESRIDCES